MTSFCRGIFRFRKSKNLLAKRQLHSTQTLLRGRCIGVVGQIRSDTPLYRHLYGSTPAIYNPALGSSFAMVLCRECKKKVDDCENTHQLICTYLFLQTGRKRVCQESTLAKRMRDRLHFGSAEAGQMHQSILKNPRNLKDIDVRFTEIYRRLEYHESIFWWG